MQTTLKDLPLGDVSEKEICRILEEVKDGLTVSLAYQHLLEALGLTRGTLFASEREKGRIDSELSEEENEDYKRVVKALAKAGFENATVDDARFLWRSASHKYSTTLLVIPQREEDILMTLWQELYKPFYA